MSLAEASAFYLRSQQENGSNRLFTLSQARFEEAIAVAPDRYY